MTKNKSLIIGAVVIAGLAYFITKAKAIPGTTIGVLDIISCTPNVNISKGSTALISIDVKALYDNVSKQLKLTTSDNSYTTTKSVSLNKDETTTVSFEIPTVNNSINYTVEVI